VKSHGINSTPKCPLYSEFVPDFAALERVSLPSAHTVLLIVVDACGVSTDVIDRVADRLLRSGLVYVCVWGADCERVHDIFDEVHVAHEVLGDIQVDDGRSEPDFALMTTWHARETLEEAIWFFIQCAFPPGVELKTVSYVAVTIGNTDWAATVKAALSDLPAFKARLLTKEDH
jgi:hypothetical protein